MSWQIEMSLVVRTLINDLEAKPTYGDDRIYQTLVVAASYVTKEAVFDTDYVVDFNALSITPDPTDSNIRDESFIGLVAMRAACFLDQSTFRTKAETEGIKSSLGSTSIAVAGNLSGYKTLLDVGPCGMYEKMKMEHNVGNTGYVRAVLSPFIGNNFDPNGYGLLDHHRIRSRDFYS